MSKAIIVLGLLLLATPALSQSSSYYDRNGHYSGSSIRHGNSTTYYDRNGHYQGSVYNYKR